MERGVYAQGWYAREHNYHPSLPPRRLKMVEDFAEYRATLITWPSLGGGPISLAYLEDEANAPIPARYRQYGFLKDSEFLEECRRRGVKAFSVIFSTQGWEFPAEFSEDEDEILALNELRGVGRRGWLGLREFTQNRYPKLWRPFERYFPDGLRNSRGQAVTDLFEECAGRDIHGEALHADWLEVPGLDQQCHYMDINNPVWREYLKAIVRLHVDAGVDGIQFDEPESPMSALRYGGCFCHDCVTGFTDYLVREAPTGLPGEVQAALPDFDYGEWLLSMGRSGFDPADPDPLGRHFVAFLEERVALNFAELVTYARTYAASKGRRLLVSANLYDGSPWTDPMAAQLDILVPEQRHTLYRQPAWMRYMAGLAGDRPASISINPYGGVIPELAPALKRGRLMDRYRVMRYEAAAMGVDLAVPYGAWMGAVIEDAMWAPHEETVEIQRFIADHEHLYGPRTSNLLGVAYSVASNHYAQALDSALQARLDPVTGRRRQSSAPVPFFGIAEQLAGSGRPFDAVILHDGRLREDDSTPALLARFERLVLPNCTDLTDRQLDAVLGYLDQGGLVTVIGELGGSESTVRSVRDHARTRTVPDLFPDVADVAAETAQVRVSGSPAIGANIVETDGGWAIHLVNYEYEPGEDRCRSLRDVEVRLRLPADFGDEGVVHAPNAPEQRVTVRRDPRDSSAVLSVPRIDTYVILELDRSGDQR